MIGKWLQKKRLNSLHKQLLKFNHILEYSDKSDLAGIITKTTFFRHNYIKSHRKDLLYPDVLVQQNPDEVFAIHEIVGHAQKVKYEPVITGGHVWAFTLEAAQHPDILKDSALKMWEMLSYGMDRELVLGSAALMMMDYPIEGLPTEGFDRFPKGFEPTKQG
ncbi:MAG: hypothetical protein ACNI27_07290 [Desulfovibrio sp.]